MRHHAEHIPPCIANTRNITGCTIRIGVTPYPATGIAIPVNDLPIGLQGIQHRIICMIATLSMGDRDHMNTAIGPLYVHIAADELHVGIAEQYAGQQPRLT